MSNVFTGRSVWKLELYKIQLEAPTPKAVLRARELPNAPEFYGYEFHGQIGHAEVDKIIGSSPDGSYLIRQSPGAVDFYTLSLRFNGKTKHYKIYYRRNEGHYLQGNYKCFDSIFDLVADGLVNFYMEIHAAPILHDIVSQTKSCYQQSPYMTLNRRKIGALSGIARNSIKSNTLIEPLNNNKSIKEDEIELLPMVFEKRHMFKIHTFKGLNWCELCANFLWGFTAQGVKCDDCGFIAHNKCSELVPAKCIPDLKRMRGVFGTDLTTLVTAHQCKVPFVIKRCVDEVETRGMLQEGIYRVSGFADEIEALKLALDRNGEKTDLSEFAHGNINVVAGTLKLYLRLLPVSLITFQAYPYFMESTKCSSVSDKAAVLRNAVKQLPQAHYDSLKFMVEHLQRISSHCEVNKMNENNLATVFAPTLIATPQHLTDLSQEIFMLASLIANCQTVFS